MKEQGNITTLPGRKYSSGNDVPEVNPLISIIPPQDCTQFNNISQEAWNNGYVCMKTFDKRWPEELRIEVINLMTKHFGPRAMV